MTPKRRREEDCEQAAPLELSSRYAITFGEVAVLHIGGAEIGVARQRGFQVEELRRIAARLADHDVQAELVMLSDALPVAVRSANEAATLVIRSGASLFLGRSDAADALYTEQLREVEYDRAYWDSRFSKTLQKRARYNVVFGTEGAKASADFKQFTIKAFNEVPLLQAFRESLPTWLGETAQGLSAEGNHYYCDASGIGFHGDSERKIVICLSLGRTSVLRYHWRFPGSSQHDLPPVDIEVQHGDVYIMSEKATGFDWRSRSHHRLVHAAGSAKYIGKD